MKSNTFCRTTCAIAVSTALLASGAAFAQQSEEGEKQTKGLERIEVTARKTVETLQEVPVSITSVGAVELAEHGMSVMTEICKYSMGGQHSDPDLIFGNCGVVHN